MKGSAYRRAKGEPTAAPSLNGAAVGPAGPISPQIGIKKKLQSKSLLFLKKFDEACPHATVPVGLCSIAVSLVHRWSCCAVLPSRRGVLGPEVLRMTPGRLAPRSAPLGKLPITDTHD